MGAVSGALAVDIVLVQDDLRRLTNAQTTVTHSCHGASGDHFPGAVPDQGVVRGKDLRRGVLGVGMVHVKTGPVDENRCCRLGQRRLGGAGASA